MSAPEREAASGRVGPSERRAAPDRLEASDRLTSADRPTSGGRVPTEPPAADRRATDLVLLRRFEPIFRFTRGEEFYPTDVEWYVHHSSLWVSHADGRRELLVPEGELDLDRLAAPRLTEPGAVLHLTFSDPLNLAQLSAFLLSEGVRNLRDPSNRFRADVARLARVGYASRFLDALFSLTLFLRGRVPGDSAAAALLACRHRPPTELHYPYYGRVVREAGWLVLQYWFFYPFNNWRSGFFGANDHEADWEMIGVYLEEDADDVRPAWVAYASHDFHGDDLRRAWDDRAELDRDGEHPVVYVAAGSHAAYFRRGEYVTEIEVPYLRHLTRPLGRLAGFWRRTLRQAGFEQVGPRPDLFRIPFVDYARGDGVAVGPGQDQGWTARLLDPLPAWAGRYRGLWGYFARDPAAGENAPSGPMYNRDGTVRRAWYDPVGWAGLDDVPTPTAEIDVARRRLDELEGRRTELDALIATDSAELQVLGVELAAIRGQRHLARRLDELESRVRALRGQLDAERRERAQSDLLRAALLARLDRLTSREPGGVTLPEERQAHIRILARPTSDADLRLRRVLEIWAATSIGLLLLATVALAAWAPERLLDGAIAMAGTFVLVEAAFQRRLARLVSGVAVGLAVVSLGVLVYEFFWELVVFAVVAAGLFILWENVRELRR